MILLPAHSLAPTRQNLHFFREDTAPDDVEAFLARFAQEANYFLGVLHGINIQDEAVLLWQVARVLEFPNRDQVVGANWNGTADWLGDLSWLTNPAGHPYAGIILFYREPQLLFDQQADSFGLLLDVFAKRSRSCNEDGMPYHFVSGPIHLRMHNFLHILKVYDQMCSPCLYY